MYVNEDIYPRDYNGISLLKARRERRDCDILIIYEDENSVLSVLFLCVFCV
jgi:hypothetical protein